MAFFLSTPVSPELLSVFQEREADSAESQSLRSLLPFLTAEPRRAYKLRAKSRNGLAYFSVTIFPEKNHQKNEYIS